MNRKLNILIGIMLCFILLASVRGYSRLPLGIAPVYYIGGYILTALSFYAFYVNRHAHSITYAAPIMYIIWALIEVFRGQFEISSWFMYNQFLHRILFVLSPICIFLFAFPITIIRSFQIFNLFNVAYSLLSFGWNYLLEAYGFAFTPFYYFYACFLTKIPKWWKFLTILAVILVFAERTNGSATVKIIMVVCVFFTCLLPKMLRMIIVQAGHWFMYVFPCLLLYFGITGRYNVFKGTLTENTNTKVVVSSHGVEESDQPLHTDTRTFIYEEMLASVLTNNYLITGSTPARGYYSPFFERKEGKIEGKENGERFASEVGHLNTFHWLGLIGLALITLVYLQGTCLALYKSNNKYLKCLSLEVAFMWLWGWVENSNRFLMLDVMIYVMLAICYSPYYRRMTDLEFESWFKSIFSLPWHTMCDFYKYHSARFLLKRRIS